MDINIIILVFKVIVLIGAFVATWFGGMLIFFYDKFNALNELLNSQYLVGKDKYGDGSGFKLDNWVLGWHTVMGLACLLVAVWLYWTFYTYMSM
ncbi:MAG: hypothetical protein JW782_00420 [Candidatus Saganbacteria bacterium]|nr:hypothetical protein [Candidatus Saganbacteria bacterium]